MKREGAPRMNIRQLRTRAGLSQEALAAKVGVGRTAVTFWEAGVQYPSADKLPKLAAALGCSIDDLYDIAAYGQEVNAHTADAS